MASARKPTPEDAGSAGTPLDLFAFADTTATPASEPDAVTPLDAVAAVVERTPTRKCRGRSSVGGAMIQGDAQADEGGTPLQARALEEKAASTVAPPPAATGAGRSIGLLTPKLPEGYRRPEQIGELLEAGTHTTLPLSVGAVYTIRSSGEPLKVLDRAIWMVLLTHAYENLNNDNVFQIKMADLRRALSDRMIEENGAVVRSSTKDRVENNTRLRESFKRIQSTLMIWNANSKDDRPWASTPLLGGLQDDPKTGVLTYEVPRLICGLLANPILFSHVRLRMFLSFTSHYAQVLYPILQMEADLTYGGTWRVPIGDLRRMLDVPAGSLASFGNLRQRALDPAIEQINRLSEFDVEMVPIQGTTRGNPVVEVEFKVTRKTGPAPYEILYRDGTTREDRQKTAGKVKAGVEERAAAKVEGRKVEGRTEGKKRKAGTPANDDGAAQPTRVSRFKPSA